MAPTVDTLAIHSRAMPITVAATRTQSERSAESNERLLCAAVELIAEKGFERTSLAEISRRAGYSHSMVSMRYGSKEALLDELLKSGWDARVKQLPQVGGSGLGQILARIDLIIAQIEDDPLTMRAFFVLFFESAGPFPGLRPRIVAWMSRHELATMRSLRAGQRDGSLTTSRRPEDDAKAASRFMAHCVGCFFRWVVEPDYDVLAELRAWRRQIASARNLV